MDLRINSIKYWYSPKNPSKIIENVKSNLIFRPQETIKIQEDNIQKIQNTLTFNFDIWQNNKNIV